MSLIDVLIIYFACGAPSSVFEVTRTDHRSAASKLRYAVLALLFWPIHLCILAGFAIVSVRQRTKNEKFESVRRKIEDGLLVGASARRVFEFRDTFYRTTSLSDAAATASPERGYRELFTVAGHPDVRLASRCAARRNLLKIRHHLDNTATELCGLISAASTAAGGATISLEAILPEVSGELSLVTRPEGGRSDRRTTSTATLPGS